MWHIVDGSLTRSFKFADWKEALAFVNKVGAVAEQMQHHPDVELGWGRVVIKLKTHDIAAVGPLDHELAKKIDALA